VKALLYVETAPGFSLPDHPPKVLLLWAADPSKPTISEQKLVVPMRRIVEEQGGVLTEVPGDADLVISVKLEALQEDQQRIEMVSTSARTTSFGNVRPANIFQRAGNGWTTNLSSMTTMNVPVVLTDKVSNALVTIDIFVPNEDSKQAESQFSARQVWQGTLKVGFSRFWKTPYNLLGRLFNHIGTKDGLREIFI